jgi:hypothetical protein
MNTLAKLSITTEAECSIIFGKIFLRFEGSKIFFVLPVINKWDQIGFSCAVKLLRISSALFFGGSLTQQTSITKTREL